MRCGGAREELRSFTLLPRWNGRIALPHRDGHRVEIKVLAHRRVLAGGQCEWFLVCALTEPRRRPDDSTLMRWNHDQVAGCHLMITGSSGSSSRPTKPRSAKAPRPASRRWPVILLWRTAVISLDRPGLAAGIQIRLPFSSVSARNGRPWICACRRSFSGYPPRCDGECARGCRPTALRPRHGGRSSSVPGPVAGRGRTAG